MTCSPTDYRQNACRRWAIVIGLCGSLMLCGCAVSGKPRTAWWKHPATETSDTSKTDGSKTAAKSGDAGSKPSSDAAVAKKEGDKSKEIPDSEIRGLLGPNPFKSSRDKGGDKPAEPAVAAGSGDAASALKTAALTADTLQLINQELQDASDEERAYWYDQLKKVDPSLVPQILKARRMTQQLTAQSSGSGSELSRPTAGLPVARSGGEPSPFPDGTTAGVDGTANGLAGGHSQVAVSNPATQAPVRNNGLGSTGPWGSPTTTVAEAAPGNLRPIASATRDPLMRPAGFQSSETNAVTHALHEQEAGTSSNVDTAFYRVDPATGRPVVQPTNHESAADPNGGRPAGFGSPQTPVASTPINRSPLASGSNITTVSSNGSPNGSDNPAAQLDGLISQLEQEVASLKPGDNPDEQINYIRKQVYLRLLYMMASRQERALTAIPGLEPADQEFWQQTFWALSNYFDDAQVPDTADRASQTVAQLQTAVARLQERARLELRNVSFCRQIWYFGNYEKFPRDEFRPGQEVLVYAEVENFRSELTAEAQYRTLLRSKIEVVSPSGDLRHQIEFPPTEDICRNRRRDYFHNYQFTIPEKIPLGPHTLKLTVVDELSGRVTTSNVHFVVK